jgi:hypothetical protein
MSPVQSLRPLCRVAGLESFGHMPKHRPFRFTRSEAKDDARSFSLLVPLVEQLVFLAVASLILDGGKLMPILMNGALAYWICVAIILIRRRRQLKPIDKIVIRIGFWAACAISVWLTPLVSHFRGV